MARKHDDSYLTQFCKGIRDLSDSIVRPDCNIFVNERGKEFPQHYYVLVFHDDDFIEYRCIYCLKYDTRKKLKDGQGTLF